MASLIQTYQSAVAFRPERFNPIVLDESERTRVILACFEPGQYIPIHHAGIDLTLVVLEGEGHFVAGDKETTLQPGFVGFVPAGEARGVKANERLVVLHIVTPWPTEEDHAGVIAGFKRGSWR